MTFLADKNFSRFKAIEVFDATAEVFGHLVELDQLIISRYHPPTQLTVGHMTRTNESTSVAQASNSIM
jgi:hypothetical protein